MSYNLDKNKIEITDGEFAGLVVELSNFESTSNALSYDYKIIVGEVSIDKGNEFKDLIISIVNDIILNYTKEHNIEKKN